LEARFASASGVARMNTLGGKQAMEKKVKLTRRGKIVLAVFVLAVVWFLFDVTTPDQCKVPVDQMNQFCIDLMYP